MTTRSTLASALFSAAASLTALAVALPTSAEAMEPGNAVSIAVPIRDLDLATAGGRAMLDQRLRSAAIDACGEASSADPAGRRLVRQCRTQLVRVGQQQALAKAAQERLAAR